MVRPNRLERPCASIAAVMPPTLRPAPPAVIAPGSRLRTPPAGGDGSLSGVRRRRPPAATIQVMSHVRRFLAGPDGPLAVALVLALAAMLQVTSETEKAESAMIANLLATLPLALLRRHLPAATIGVVFGVVVALSGQPSKVTVAAVLALLTVTFEFAARYGRRWSV